MIITETAKDYGDNNGISATQTDGSSFERSSSLAPWGVVMEFSTDSTIYGSTIYYNPFIHTNVGTVEYGLPPRGYYYKVPASGALTATMAPFSIGSYAPQRETLEVQIEIIDGNTFIIRHTYSQWFDHGGMYPNVAKDAYDILFKSHQSAPSQFVNTFSSVYNSIKTFYGHVYCKPVTPDTPGEAHVYFGVKDLFYNTLRSGWTSLQFLSRLSGPVTNLSAYEKTKVTFQLNRPTGTSDTAPEAFMFLFRGDPGFPTNAQPVYLDVAAEIQPMADDPGTGSIFGGKIYGPIVQPFLTGDTWEASFYIGGVATGERYHAAILWYIHPDDGPPAFYYTVTLINTTETPYIVAGEPEPLPLIITGEFDDYTKTISAAYPFYAPVQRYKWRGIIDGSTYDAAALSYGLPFTNIATDLQTLTLEISAIGTLETFTAYRTLGGWITSNPNLIIQDFGTSLYVEFDFHAMYGGAFANWISGGVFFKLTAGFDYTAIVPGFLVNYEFTDNCTILQFEGEGHPLNLITRVNLYNLETGLPLTMICGDDDILVEVLMPIAGQGHDPEDYVFQAFVDRAPFGVNLYTEAGLKEEESYPYTLSIFQRTTAIIYDVDPQFSAAGKAYFKVVASMLTPGVQYYVYGAAIKKTLP